MKYRSFLNFEGEANVILVYIGFYHTAFLDCSTISSERYQRDIRIISQQNFLCVHLPCSWKQVSDSMLNGTERGTGKIFSLGPQISNGCNEKYRKP